MSDIYVKRDGTEVEITDANRGAIDRLVAAGRGSIKSSGLQQPTQANEASVKSVKARPPKDPIISEAELKKKLDAGSESSGLFDEKPTLEQVKADADNASSPFSLVGAGLGAAGAVATVKMLPRLVKGLRHGFTTSGKIAKAEAKTADLLKGAQTDHTAAIINKAADQTIAKITRDELLGVTNPAGSLLSQGMAKAAVPGAVVGGVAPGYLAK